MLRKAALVLSGNAASSLLLLARNLLVARLIPVEDYGVASTLLLALAVVEMSSALGLQQQIVQARDGDDPRVQAALQGFQVVRAVVASLALVGLAGPLADLMNVPEAVWGYRAMALVPVLSALVHFDVHRLSRTMQFGPMMLVGVVPAALSLLAVWPLAAWLGDWRTMLGAILLQWMLAALLSHLVAHRPYRLVLDRAQMAQSLRFGWPLLLNSALLFLVFNGDRIIVGRELGMAALGVFSMGVTLTLTPMLVLERSVQALFLPRLSRIDRSTAGSGADALGVARLATEATLAAALAFLVAVAVLGGPAVVLLLGERYAALPPLLVLLAAGQAARVAKAVPSVLALAVGRTGNAMAANLVRLATLPLAWWALGRTGEVQAVLWIALAGEVGGYVLAALLARRSAPGWLRATALPHLSAALVLLAATIHGSRGLDPEGGLDLAGLAFLLGAFGAALWSFGTLRRYLWPRR